MIITDILHKVHCKNCGIKTRQTKSEIYVIYKDYLIYCSVPANKACNQNKSHSMSQCGSLVLSIHTWELTSLVKSMAPHSSTLAWKLPWTEEPGRLRSMGSLRVRHNLTTSLSLFTFMHWRRKWQPTPVFLPGGSQGRGTGGLPSMRSHRVGQD